MDFLHFDSTFNVLICTSCKYALHSTGIARHLYDYHKSAAPPGKIQEYIRLFTPESLLAPREVKQLHVPINTLPIRYLRIYDDAYCCKLCHLNQPFVIRTRELMVNHLREVHQWNKNQKIRGTKAYIPFKDSTYFPVVCQTFHTASSTRRYFLVNNGRSSCDAESTNTTNTHVQPSSTITIGPPPATLREQKLQASKSIITSRHKTEVSPWLDLTQWEQYLQGYNLSQVVHLRELPTPHPLFDPDQADNHLVLILESFDRLIDQARESLRIDRINIFDQQREGTYIKYKKVWKQLISFVYRRVWLNQGPDLSYRITDAQATALDRVMQAATDLAQEQQSSGIAPASLQQNLDYATSHLCISLLDHTLFDTIYDSIVVAFMAVLGIRDPGLSNDQNAIFSDSLHYTPYLSVFIKIAQLLVIQKAVISVDRGEVSYIADILNVMQERFMVYGTHSPMNWAQKLCSFGKQINEVTTSLGYIIWTDDGEYLSYKGLELGMTDLKKFLSTQTAIAQSLLEELLYVHPDEERDNIVPPINLYKLKDDPANSKPGWSFLDDPRNEHLQGHDRWLLNRVLDEGWLQQEFLMKDTKAVWRRKTAEQYLQKANTFLERLLLLIHMLGGQFVRGTELLSLQLCNTAHGLLRNIFIENGLVSFVTYYHKGYSISGSTKIIHRYLPEVISELLVYYVWLIQPFCEQLCILALNESPSVSTFLWAIKKGTQSSLWPSSRLTNILVQQFKQHLNTDANILLWRHAAIAISRRHIRQAKFRKDYGTDATGNWSDAQAAHTANTAGMIYARGMEEAPGHIASARAEYRQISREWHTYLGFSGFKRIAQIQLVRPHLQTLNPRQPIDLLVDHQAPLKRKALS
ncbi:hypothetical protein BOTCAL_1739g00010 [Botryotinia calthae]|uniref:Uncharacterized protein n=1 Tax=Botryotinia calthae TaxID=38488 RepID=A0A4Y8CCR4_9HELO|nr:hypothetical protein BOTCAL_1739g00010 [Botryotinia calthae]